MACNIQTSRRVACKSVNQCFALMEFHGDAYQQVFLPQK